MAWPSVSAGTDTVWMIVSSDAPWFISAITSATSCLQRVGDVAEHHGDALLAGDRQPVRRHEKFRACSDHLAQRGGPLRRIALHLLRVAGVRESSRSRSRRP